MRCPRCAETKGHVIDSREAEDGFAVRRRRECGVCGYRFTTFERSLPANFLVIKRSGEEEPFDRLKVIGGVQSACKNRPVDEEAIEELAIEVEEALRSLGRHVTSEEVGVTVLDRLRQLDDVAYLRFASVYKGFDDIGDFAREVGLLTKTTEPKHHERA